MSSSEPADIPALFQQRIRLRRRWDTNSLPVIQDIDNVDLAERMSYHEIQTGTVIASSLSRC